MLIGLAACLTLGACVFGRDRAPAPLAAAAPAGLTIASDGELAFEEVAARRLEPDQCPLVLWSRAAASQRIFIAFHDPAVAVVRVGGREVSLPRSAVAGAAAFGHHEVQTYGAAGGPQVVADVRFNMIEGQNDGAVIRSASVSLTSPTGETLIVPAVGLVSCGADARTLTRAPQG
jgi:hypothetical protein